MNQSSLKTDRLYSAAFSIIEGFERVEFVISAGSEEDVKAVAKRLGFKRLERAPDRTEIKKRK